ncbi:MAG: hypothetical protein SVV80_03690 [Planctomycetota bacterium]|nr:hypothetical protein [Planctomycetota bacterium]
MQQLVTPASLTRRNRTAGRADLPAERQVFRPLGYYKIGHL